MRRRLRFVFLALLGVVIAPSIAMQAYAAQASPEPVATGSDATRASSDDRARLLAALKPMLALTSFRATLTFSYDAKPFVNMMEFVAPDRVRSTNPAASLIAIGAKTWIRPAGESAWKPGTAGDPQTLNPMDLLVRATEGAISYVDGGVGMWNGIPAHLYRLATLSGSTTTSTATLYFFSDKLIHHIASSNSSGTTTIDFTDFDSPAIKIDPPV